ncbi:MAG: serine/threonine-protein kinase [Anaerolineaceae bacterium]|nr:serine/threonine-protein kinase [Anaerolineaceae bacterium]
MTIPINHLLHGRYNIKQSLHRGGMGAVYIADDIVLKVEVVVKENLFTTLDHSRQFRREATILASLRHPALPRVIDHFTIENSGEYLVMDYIPGEDLREILERTGKPLRQAEAVKIGVAVCDALSYLHHCKPPIVHRDVKPANIKISTDGSVHLVDFGLAKLYQAGELTTTGAQGITAGYSPVEQYAHGTDARSDIYALGATLYNALTNTQPLDALERAMGNDQLIPLGSINPSISEGVARVIEQAMSLDVEQRFQTSEAFKNALLAEISASISLENKLPVTNEFSPPSESMKYVSEDREFKKKSTERNADKPKRWLVWFVPLLFVLSILIIAGVVFLPGLINKTNPSLTTPGDSTNQVGKITESILSSEVQGVNPTPQPYPTKGEAVVAPISTPTQAQANTPSLEKPEQIAFVSEREGDLPQIWLVNRNGTDLEQLTNEPQGACQPAWSPDGMRLVYVSPCNGRAERYDGASLIVLNLQTGVSNVISLVRSGDYDPAWSPDGTKIAYTSIQTGKPQIFIYDLALRTSSRLMNRSTISRQPAWSADGNQIAFVAPHPITNQPQVWLVSATGESEPRLVEEGAWRMMLNPAWSREGSARYFDLGVDDGIVRKEINGEEETLANILQKPETPDISFDDQWLVCAAQDSSSAYDNFIFFIQTGEFGPIAPDPAQDYQPAWRP